MIYRWWGLESTLESIEDTDWSVYGLEADGEKHPHEVFLKRGNKKISVFHKKDGIYMSPRKNVVFDSNTGIVNEYHGNKLHKTSYVHKSSPLGFKQVVELSAHPKEHLLASRFSDVGHMSDVAEQHLVRTHIEQIKHILAQARGDEGELEKSIPLLKHHLEEIRKISEKVLKEKPGVKEREKWERLHDEAAKYHELVDEGDFSKLRRSLKMEAHTARETPSHDEDRGLRRITHDRNIKSDKDFDEIMRADARQKAENAHWGEKARKAARDAEVEKKAMAEMERLRKERKKEEEAEKWRGRGHLVPIRKKEEEAKKGLSLAHKLALGAGGVAAAGALGWATKGRGRRAADAVKDAHKGWSTGKKIGVGAAGAAGLGAVG